MRKLNLQRYFSRYWGCRKCSNRLYKSCFNSYIIGFYFCILACCITYGLFPLLFSAALFAQGTGSLRGTGDRSFRRRGPQRDRLV